MAKQGEENNLPKLYSKRRLYMPYIINHVDLLFKIQIIGLTELSKLGLGPSDIHP